MAETVVSSMGPKHCQQPTQVLGVQEQSPVAWAADGRTLAFMSKNFGIFLFQLGDDAGGRVGHITGLLDGHTSSVKQLAFHPSDPSVLASVGTDSVRVWNTSTGQQLADLQVGTPNMHDRDVECVAWAFDGACLLTGGRDNNIIVWDAMAGYRYMETLVGHKDPVLVLAFNAASGRLASAGRDSTIKIWNGASLAAGEWREKRREDSRIACELITNLDGHRGDVTALTWTTDGSRLFSGARDNTLKLWNADAGVLVREIKSQTATGALRHKGDITSIVILPSTSEDVHIMSASMDGELWVWKLGGLGAEVDGDLASGISGMGGGGGDGDGDGGGDGMDSWEQDTQALLDKILQTDAPEVVAGAVDAVDTIVHSQLMFSDDGISALELNPASPVIALSCSESSVVLTRSDQAPLPVLQRFDGHTGAIVESELVGDDQTLVTASEDFTIALYDTASTNRVAKFNFGGAAHSLAVGPGNLFAYVGGAGYVIKAFAIQPAAYADLERAYAEMRTPVPAFEYECLRFVGHAGRVDALSVSLSGDLLASGARDFNIFLWSLTSPGPTVSRSVRSNEDAVPSVTPLLHVDAHVGAITSLKFSPVDPDLLASCGTDHSVKFWSLSRPAGSKVNMSLVWSAEKAEQSSHTSVVTAVSFGKGASSAYLFSGGWDSVIKVWSATPGSQPKPLTSLSGHTLRVTDLDTSNDGTVVVSTSADFSARMWRATGDFACLAVYHSYPTDGSLDSVSCGSSFLITSAASGTVYVWPVYAAGADADDRFTDTPPESKSGLKGRVGRLSSMGVSSLAVPIAPVAGGSIGGGVLPPPAPGAGTGIGLPLLPHDGGGGGGAGAAAGAGATSSEYK